MAARTKSFFEQDHGNKHRPPHWHRQQNRPALADTNVNLKTPKPPIPATEQSKAKLQSFQFTTHTSDLHHQDDSGDEKENTLKGTEGHAQKSDGASDAALYDGYNESAVKKECEIVKSHETSDAPIFPSTPAARLPIEDLIGNVEPGKKVQTTERSPEEYISWIPNSSSTLLTPNRKKRKRARSSSPSCPSASQKYVFTATAGANAGQPDKTTPEADPAADLWQRYGGKQVGDEARMPDFSHLIFQGSPSMLETPLKSAGLRRWASTGNDWPTSKSKRQKIEGKINARVHQAERIEEAAGRSKVAAMLDKIQASLASQRLMKPMSKPADHLDGPSSSSPLPAAGSGPDFNSAPMASPLQAKHQSRFSKSVELAQLADNQPKRIDTPSDDSSPTGTPNAIITVQGAPALVLSATLPLKSKAPLPAYKRPSFNRVPSGSGVQYPPRVAQLQVLSAKEQEDMARTLREDLDVFDTDFDFSVEDLEELMEDKAPSIDRYQHRSVSHTLVSPQNSSDDAMRAGRPGGLEEERSIPVAIDDDDDDEFGCDDIDEDILAQVEISATQALRKTPQTKSRHDPQHRSQISSLSAFNSRATPCGLQRLVIKQIVEGEYRNDRNIQCTEKLLLAEDVSCSRITAITLRDSWVTTAVEKGDVVHVATISQPLSDSKSPSSPLGQITISDTEHSPVLVVHPDHMLSATTVADSFDCGRKAVLQDRIKATGETSKAMVYGKILHEIVQQALSAHQWDQSFLDDQVERTILHHLEGLWELGMQETVLAREEIRAKMGELAAWANVFVTVNPSEVASVDGRNGEKALLAISKLIAIEEHIWSPRYGLKGNIDATIQATLIDHPGRETKKLIMPFEIKTGKSTNATMHRAQTALYTLLLSDRYDVLVGSGILYYLETSAMSRIAPPVVELRQMIQQRNRLASQIYRARHPDRCSDHQNITAQSQISEQSNLPALLKNPYKCGKCYAQASCFTFHALVEGGSAESAGMVDDGKKNHNLSWQEAVGHLKLENKDKSNAEALKKWFTKWDRLLTFEERETSRLSKEIWTMNSAEREACGRCFGHLTIATDLALSSDEPNTLDLVDGLPGTSGKINRFVYTFVRAGESQMKTAFTEGSQLTVGDPIVVSSEQGQWALANGYLVSIAKASVTVAVDRRLGNARDRLEGFHDQHNQAFRGIMDVSGESASLSKSIQGLYRIDKDEFSNGLALIRNNLVNLMSSHPINTKLRNQLIHSAAPQCRDVGTVLSFPPSQLGRMNSDQEAAVEKVLKAEDYALILGMPGTGKTTTIAHLIRALLADNKSILLTSFTHTAVDNILLKIRDIVPAGSILRLGVPAKINPEVQTFCQLGATPRRSIDEIQKAYMETKIVATTCMGTNHALFNRRAFDICIVDEASQITLPTSIGPLLHARKYVLVGDHYQLPPLVQNRAALEGGLDVSLFRQLSEQHPEAVAMLGEQYRMCEDIMSLSNALIYDGQLRCGTLEVAAKMLPVTDLSAMKSYHTKEASCSSGSQLGQCWLQQMADPSKRVLFANTDSAGKSSMESLTSGKNITNTFEATLSAQTVLALLAVGVPAKEIGVITLYRSQITAIRRQFKAAGVSPQVEIDSADRFQGRDKECIVLSLVRSNESGIVGDLLKDWRRVNVALTRARSKLIVLGSRRTLRNNDLLAKFLDLVDKNRWTIDLPADATESHGFDWSTQAVLSTDSNVQHTPPKAQQSPFVNKSARSEVHVSGEKAATSSALRTLQSSQDIGSQSPTKGSSTLKQPVKTFRGGGVNGGSKARRIKEQIAFEIFEDLTADDI